MARMVDSSGSFVGNEFQVDTAGDSTDYPSVAALADGGFAITWQGDPGGGNDIKAKVYNADGSVRTAEFTVTGAANSQTIPKITGLPSGGFAVSWTDQNTDGSSFGAYMATFDANGTSVASATLLNQTTTGAQGDATVVRYSLADLADSASGNANAGTINIRQAINYGNFATYENRRQAEADIETAIETIRSAAGHFVSNVTLLSTRMDFNQAYAGTLSAGAGKLTLADLNEEGANMLAMQSRTQLSAQALTFTSKAEQDILQIMK
jgi:hypothetical protein